MTPDPAKVKAVASEEALKELARLYPQESEDTEAEIVDHHKLEHLYTHIFKNGKGKYFTVVSEDGATSEVVEIEHPGRSVNKIKTRLTFIKSEGGGSIRDIEIKRFKYLTKRGYVPQEEGIRFTYPFFKGLIGFLQSIESLNLSDITERRIPLVNGPDLDDETKRQFHTLASTQQGQELIREAVKNGQVTGSDIVNIGYRKSQLAVFESMMTSPGAVASYRAENDIQKPGDEAVWQHFFEINTWIFGYGLSFIFNQPLEGQKLETVVKGHDMASPGKRSDALLKTSGVISSICLVEIKTPATSLLNGEEYRPGCWRASNELSGGISQVQKTIQKTIENIGAEFRPKDEHGNPTGEVLHAYRPKSFLLIGTLAEFETPEGTNTEKFGSFELLRRSTSEPEVITFDELLERARFIVSNS